MCATSYFPCLTDIKNAAEKLKGVAAITPLMYNANFSEEYEASIYFKREDLQVVRSYKIRGAFNKICHLSPKELARGVVCASAGNHAQGVAYSCSKLGIVGIIFMPIPTSAQKIEQVKMFGKKHIQIRLVGDTFDDAQQAARKYCESNEMVFIPPFDDEKVIEGQGTVALEILDQAEKPIDYLLLPVGGGGLAAGVAAAFRKLSPHTKIIGVEPEGAPSMSVSLKKSKNTKLEQMDKFIDGAAVQKVGELNFNICKKVIDEMLTVPEGAVCETILQLYNKEAIVVEPAGALTLTALLQLQTQVKGKNVVCVVSGGNNDITRTEEIKERAILHKGLKHYFVVRFPQRTGALKEFVAEVLGPTDDITHFEYSKKHNRNLGPAIIGIELKNKNDLPALKQRMKDKNFYGEYLNEKADLFQFLV